MIREIPGGKYVFERKLSIKVGYGCRITEDVESAKKETAIRGLMQVIEDFGCDKLNLSITTDRRGFGGSEIVVVIDVPRQFVEEVQQ